MPRAERSPASTEGPGIRPRSGVALYAQVAGLFRHRIVTGQWPPGQRLDNLNVLAARHGVGRVTMRQAVARLVDEGLLSAQRGRGIAVLGSSGASAMGWADIVGSLDDSEGVRIDVVRDQTAEVVPPEVAGERPPAGTYREICTVHSRRGQAFALMRMFVADDVYRQLPPRALSRSKLLGLILEHAPTRADRVRQRMTVEPADIAVAQSLGYAMGAPVARIVRQLHDARHRLVYAGISWYRGDCFETDITLPLALWRGSAPRR